MTHKTILFSLLALLIVLSLACSAGAPSSSDPAAAPASNTQAPAVQVVTATPDAQATINAAVAATAQAQAAVQATVSSMIVATVGAMPPTATPVPPVDGYTLSEEELEAMIEQAVNEAVVATTQATTSTTQATADNTVNSEEAQTMQVYVYGAEQAIAYAYSLVNAYSQVYGDLALEALDAVAQVEGELDQMSASIDALNTTLQQVNATLQQGQALAQETIDQLEAAAQSAQQAVTDASTQLTVFKDQVQTSMGNREREVGQLQPDNIPTDLQTTLAGAFSFVDQVRGALGDQKLDRTELTQLAQFSSNLTAGFQAHGGPAMQGMSGKLSEITQQLARGQGPKVERSLGEFERSLGQRPANLPQPGGLPRPQSGGGLPGRRP